MQRIQERAKRVPPWLRTIIILPTFILPVYWGFTYSGLYRVLAEWQLRVFGQYYVMLTGLVTLLALLIPAAVVVQFLAGALPEPNTPSRWDAKQVEQWLTAHMYRFAFAIVSVALVFVGLFFYWSASQFGEQTELSAQTLENGGKPSTRNVRVKGRLLYSHSVAVVTRGSSKVTKVYIPIVSMNWRYGQPIKLYLHTYQNWLRMYHKELSQGKIYGTLTADDLAGVAITTLTRRYGKTPRDYWVLDYRNTPKQTRKMGLALGVSGLIVGLLVMFVWWWMERKSHG